MLKKLLFLLALLSAAPAFGQSVQQSGSVTRNHIPVWNTSGVISDGGSSTDSPITSIGVTNEGGAGFCVSSQRQTAAGRNQLCFGASTTGPATISLQNYGTASAQNLQFVINGVVTTLPSGGGNFIFGNPPFVAGDIPSFLNTNGVLQDSGLAVSTGIITNGTWRGSTIGIPFGGTGASTASTARTNLGLGTLALQNANSVSITGGAITGLPTPVVASDAAIKSYVDAFAAGLNILASSGLATSTALPNSPTYSNGTAGVGATLTAGSNTTLTVDGTVAVLNSVVLVKNQASAFQNGIYTVTTAGSGSATWVLTRATYFDQPAEMKAGSYTFITAGSTNANTAWVMQAAVATVGTDPAIFNMFSAVSGTLTIGSTPVAGATNGDVLFNNNGILGQIGVSGSGSVALVTSPVFTTPSLGVASATTLNGIASTNGIGSTEVIGIGSSAGGSANGASYSIFIGQGAGQNCTTCSQNVIVGAGASGSSIIADTGVTLLGYDVAPNLHDGTQSLNYDTAVGHAALHSCTTCRANVAMGRSAMNAETTGAYNTSAGHASLFTGSGNTQVTAIGDTAGGAALVGSPIPTGFPNIGTNVFPFNNDSNVECIGETCGKATSANRIQSFAIGSYSRIPARDNVGWLGNGLQALGTAGRVWDGTVNVFVSNNVGETLPCAQLLSGLIVRSGSPSAGFNDTTPTAQQIVQCASFGPGNSAEVPVSLTLDYLNGTGQIATMVSGTGVSLGGLAQTTVSGGVSTWRIIVTNSTLNSEAVTMYKIR